MPFSFAAHALVDSSTLSKFVFGSDDGTTGLTTQQIFAVELSINAISRQIMRHVSSDIKAAAYTETWDGAGSDEIVPAERPINSVTSVKFSGNGDFSASENLVNANGVITNDKYSIKFRSLRTPVGRGLIQVIYNAGYTTVPEDIQLAALLQFQWAYKKIGKGDAMVGLKTIAKSVGGGSESQMKDDSLSSSALISEVVGMLRDYRRFEPPSSIMFARVS